MSDVDEYREALKAKVDGIQRDQQEKSMLLDDTSLKQNLPTPSPEFIQAHVGNEPPMSEAEIKMKAWQELEQERTANIEQPSNEAVWQTEKINTEFNRENAQQQADDQQQEKEAQRQRDQEIADNKNRQIEADKEKQRLANEQQQQEEQDRIQQQAAARDQAQRDKEQAQVNLAQQQPDNDYSQNRAMFEQAAARTQGMDREIE